jgi:hypothetical protein
MLLNLPPVAMCMYNGRYSVDFPDAHIAVPEAPSSHFFCRKKKGIHIAVRRGGGATSQMPTWTSPTDPDRIDPMFVMDEVEEDTDDPYPPRTTVIIVLRYMRADVLQRQPYRHVDAGHVRYARAVRRSADASPQPRPRIVRQSTPRLHHPPGIPYLLEARCRNVERQSEGRPR